jgi:hypothetical protein
MTHTHPTSPASSNDTVIGIDPELLEERGVFFEGVFVEDLDGGFVVESG